MSGSKLKNYFSEIITGGDIFLHAAEEVLELKKTKYQELALIQSPTFGKTLLLDNICQISEVDEFIYHELLVHTPCIFHSNPKNVLILGGGDGCALREALRWKSVENVTLVDIDEEVVNYSKTWLTDLNQNSLNHPKARIIIEDAFNFIKNSDLKWDIIICDLSDPIENSPALALFTKEFFESLTQISHPQTIISVQSGPAAPPDHFCFTRVANTLKRVFPYFKACLCFCQAYITPLAFSIVSSQPFKKLNAGEVENIIQNNLEGDLKYLDGETFLASQNLPKFLKQALEKEQVVYTLDNLPQWFNSDLNKNV
ncbi:MAG: hypothetical protein Q9M37_01265 [Desulfonauticus sp.]|nr:hypothetical protein [Desulfonauticus sp.]